MSPLPKDLQEMFDQADRHLAELRWYARELEARAQEEKNFWDRANGIVTRAFGLKN